MRRRFYRIAVPDNVHPVLRRLYVEMNAQHCTHIDLSERSGVAANALRDWRRHGKPTLGNLEAALNVLGLTLTVKQRNDDR